MSKLTSLKNPSWADESHTMIDCEITTSQFGDEILPFTASIYDSEEHGKQIFSDLVAGVYGEISEFVPKQPTKIPLSSPEGDIGVAVL